MAIDLAGPVSRVQRSVVLASCVLAIAAITLAERYSGRTVPLGGFYLLPLVVAAPFVSRWSIFALAIATAFVSEYFGPFAWGPESLQRLAPAAVAFTGGGLFAGELARNRRITIALLRETQQEARVRLDAVTEMRALLESSPVGLITIDSLGKIGMANAAACRLLGFTSDSPEGDPIENYIPVLARLLRSPQVLNLMQTKVEASGRRRTGETFLSQAWVSSYDDASGPRLAVVLSDATELIRDREESGLKQLLTNSRIVAGAVSHELRNLAAAGSVLYHNLRKQTDPSHNNKDFQALGTVVESILKLSSTELADASEEVLEGVDVGDLLQELRAIISPSLEEAGIGADWEIEEGLPPIRVDRSGLLQVFLNLTKNSRNALQHTSNARVRVTAYSLDSSVVIRISDNGPGISSAERLFQPFQPGASSTGLGLFVSRAIIRTFGGELHHLQPTGECSFVIEIPAMVVGD
jgi:two-component system, LuxR family, sensor kinase FixL